MRRRPRQISLKECYDILKLKKDADTADLKRAYRRRAFELHPDLNPGNPDASKDFQLLNEAYVALSAVLKHEDTVRASTEASRAEQEEARARAAKDEAEENERQASARAEKEARQNASAESESARQAGAAGAAGATGPTDSSGAAGTNGAAGAGAGEAAGGAAGANRASRQEQAQTGAKGPSAGQQGAQNGYSEHDVLRDLLTDPFARRVFEDIYSELNRQHQAETPPPRQEEPAPEQPKAKPAAAEKRNVKLHQSNLAWGTPKWNKEHSKGVTGMVKGWLRRQIDEEQSLTLPSANLAPGKRIRLQIRQALSGELKTVEITLPPDFAVGKPIRLRGLGKRVGPWQGDLYLILTNE
ncbi:MAG: J domain-containing protein [Desulfovibrio sp.]|uniref:J domain-containing protein n=1 Tax=Desulfovibrio sp. TaxID=885 RepID=UPI00135D1AF7|nr:J domain-containing protein [Desulfovibrio sp.]MTJ92399.1 J domain-containing protein [Desulfovibrio sp.]